jgi:membrane-associated phospholipid phosphatase
MRSKVVPLPVRGAPRAARPLFLLLSGLLVVLGPVEARAQLRPPPPAVAWGGAGAALIGAFMLDREIREEMLETKRGLTPLSRVGNALGRPELSLPVIGALYGIGRLTGRPGLSASAFHATAALAAVGVVNGAMKAGFGRGRPATPGADGDELHPLSFRDSGWQSFPSGHTMVAFSLATAISEEAHNPWVSGLAYGTAALVGWSRVYDNKHWASDVVAGALLSTTISHFTIKWLHRHGGAAQHAPRLGISPTGMSISIPTR